jgi:1-acyl-sn-glycerol-3-phosphate acyltransferase
LFLQKEENMSMELYRKIYKRILACRYKVHIHGAESLGSECPKLILPNHISHMDPQLMSIYTYEYTDFVPVVAAGFFKIPIIKYFLKNLNAIKVGDFKKGNFIENVKTQLLQAMEEKKSAMIFPSGQLSTDGIERIYNKQSTHSIVNVLPDNALILGVRIKGLYGSIWSTAWNGKRPEFFSTYLISVIYFFANLIFFAPKRKVILEFVDITEEAKRAAKKDRKSFNSYLENFYNENGPEKAVFIRHLFYFPRIRNTVKKV